MVQLLQIGIRGKMFNIIRSIYTDVKTKVKFNTNLSEEFAYILGVRQDECLSPFLFAMYINDLEHELYTGGRRRNRYWDG